MTAYKKLLVLLPCLFLMANALFAQTPTAAVTKKEWRIVVVSTLTDDKSQTLVAELETRVGRALSRTDVRAKFVVIVMQMGQTVEQPITAALRHKPDLLVAMAASLAAEARRQDPKVPIVFKTVFDPVATGLVEPASRPGRNMTGYSNHVAIYEKRWEMFTQAAPRVRKIGVLLNQSYYNSVAQQLPVVLASGVQAVLLKWQPSDGMPKLELMIRQSNLQALDVGLGALHPSDVPSFIMWAREKKMPTIFYARWYVKLGGLFAYEAIALDNVAVISEYVREILLGASAGDLPISYPKLFSTSLNANTAAALGIKPPSTFLKRVDHLESN